jgi:hypothetical protein
MMSKNIYIEKKFNKFNFAGLTIYEAAGAGPLPKNGDLWHAFRDGHLPDLPYLSSSMNTLLKVNARYAQPHLILM